MEGQQRPGQHSGALVETESSAGHVRLRALKPSIKAFIPPRVVYTIILAAILAPSPFMLTDISSRLGLPYQLYSITDIARIMAFGVEMEADLTGIVIGIMTSAAYAAIVYFYLLPELPSFLGSSWGEVRRSISLLLGTYKGALRLQKPNLLLLLLARFNRIKLGSSLGCSIAGRRAPPILCPNSIVVENAVYEKIYENPLRLLKFPASPRLVRVAPLRVFYATLVASIAGLVVLYKLNGYIALSHLLGLLLLPIIAYVGTYTVLFYAATGDLVFWRSLRATRIDEELPYITAFTGSLLFSGLNIANVFNYALRLKYTPEFRRLSEIIQRLQKLTGRHLLDVMEQLAEVHPSESTRVFLGTIVTLEKVGAERFAAVSKLQEVFMERLQRKIRGFIDTTNLLVTLSMMLFVMVPMMTVIALFLFSSMMGPERFSTMALLIPILSAIGMLIIIKNVYIYEVSESISLRISLPALIAALVVLTPIFVALAAPNMYYEKVVQGVYVRRLAESLSPIIGVPVTDETLINYSVVIVIIISLIMMVPIIVTLRRYMRVQNIIMQMQEMIRSIAEQAKIGIRPVAAIKKFIEAKYSKTRSEFYRLLYARLSYGVALDTLLEGISERVGFQLPRGMYRFFEILNLMERIGLEPRSIERYADTLVEVYEVKNEVRRQARSAAYLGLTFVVMLALLVAAVKVAVVDGLESLSELSRAARQANVPVIQFTPLDPAQRMIALMMVYYATLLNAFMLGYVSGTIMTNSAVTAAPLAVVATLVESIVILFLPLIQNYMPFA